MQLERALKWKFVLHQLLLRRADAHGSKRAERAYTRRFALFAAGEMHALLDSWKRDVSQAAARPYRPLDASASVRLAVRLIEQGCLSKAMTYLSSRGPRSPAGMFSRTR